MRGKFIILLVLLFAAGFFNFWNAHRIVRQTKHLARLETEYLAVKNINTELRVELDELRSGKNKESLVRVGAEAYQPEQEQGKIIYVHEPADVQDPGSYCIIDLFATKAQAKEVQVMLD